MAAQQGAVKRDDAPVIPVQGQSSNTDQGKFGIA
jgi:hypothetical protein